MHHLMRLNVRAQIYSYVSRKWTNDHANYHNKQGYGVEAATPVGNFAHFLIDFALT